MNAVRAHLVRRDAQLVLLLTPPFDRMAHDPGYIKGYLPGVRENGGQYTHAALWAVIALARLGMGDEAMELFHMINPINHMRTRGRRRALPCRAVRRGRRRLRAPDARRPRRLDVVHRLGGMDVSGGGPGAARTAAARRDHQHQPVHSGGVAGVLARVDESGARAIASPCRIPNHQSRGIGSASSMASRLMPARDSAGTTMAATRGDDRARPRTRRSHLRRVVRPPLRSTVAELS